MSPDEQTLAIATWLTMTPRRRDGLLQPLGLTFAHAYAVQAEVGRLREQRGERIIGYKVGCTSNSTRNSWMQEPIFGRIFDTGCYWLGACSPHSWFANLAVEASWRCGSATTRPERPFGAGVSAGGRGRLSRDRAARTLSFPKRGLRGMVDRQQWHARGIRVRGGGAGRRVGDVAYSLSIRINEVVVGAVKIPRLSSSDRTVALVHRPTGAV